MIYSFPKIRIMITGSSLLLVACPVLQADSLIELMQAGHYKRARVAAEDRLRTNPADAEANYALGRSLGALGMWQEAVKPAEKAIELNGRDSALHHLIADIAGQLAMRAPIHKQFGWARRAKKEFETAYQLDRLNLDNLFSLSNYLWQAPGLIGGDRKRARELVESMKKVEPCRGHLTEAFLHGVSKNLDSQLGALSMAVKDAPRCYDAHFALAAFHARRMDWTAVELSAEEAIRVDTTRGRAYELLAAALAAQGKLSVLDALLKRAEAAVPDDLRPYLSASRRVQDPRLAAEYMKKYRSQEPEGLPPALQPARSSASSASWE